MKDIETIKKECKVLAKFKIAALKSGTRRELFSEFHKSSKLGYTNFTAGHYIEIVMAWMLGYFRAITGIRTDVTISWRSDFYESTDFDIEIGGQRATLDLKFNKPSSADTADTNDKVDYTIRVWPIQKGTEALSSVIGLVMPQKNIDWIFSEYPDMAAVVDKVWKNASSNW